MQTFGKPTAECLERPAAYALLHTPGGIPLVEPKPGVLFLPGGGIEAGESPEATVLRELLEEARISAQAAKVFCEAIQHFTSSCGQFNYVSHMRFVACTYDQTIAGVGNHPVRFASELPAANRFAHESHYWALAQYLSRDSQQARPERQLNWQTQMTW